MQPNHKVWHSGIAPIRPPSSDLNITYVVEIISFLHEEN